MEALLPEEIVAKLREVEVLLVRFQCDRLGAVAPARPFLQPACNPPATERDVRRWCWAALAGLRGTTACIRTAFWETPGRA